MAFNYKHSNSGMTQPMAEINTTPLVDVMLVLLVIFIITAPLFNQAVPIDLPRVDASRMDDKPRTVQVALDAQGKVFVDGTEVAFESLDARLRASISAGMPAPEMQLRADRGTRYERVTAVMAVAQKNGISKIAFMTGGEDHV
ncbi:biopolymer transporter ExbD [Noviherbaspirillum sp.]|uniref:ExbD/TolR family protein n=1 Tax=Noviherbaspirillum sp. TaxID=1926288 RepID=UPI002B4A0E3C|nr:biopolymer transporter ExbD [Noviherbaspirillum sp.]HJV80369.1 biopolymer transporter ExbD [Noviherbaspirillum sp.]